MSDFWRSFLLEMLAWVQTMLGHKPEGPVKAGLQKLEARYTAQLAALDAKELAELDAATRPENPAT